jgi:hypothetical protein
MPIPHFSLAIGGPSYHLYQMNQRFPGKPATLSFLHRRPLVSPIESNTATPPGFCLSPGLGGVFRRVALLLVLVTGHTRAEVDWRSSQSPVKDQGARGTCAAFAICGAMETFPGIPTDLSEQLLYATVKRHQASVNVWMNRFGQPQELSEGDVFGSYPGLFDLVGTCPESFLPYDPNPLRIAPGAPEEIRRFLELAQVTPAQLASVREGYGKYGFKATQCEVLNPFQARDAERLKRLLDSGMLAIPVGYQIHATNWSQLEKTGNAGPDGRRLFVHPGMMEEFGPVGGKWMSYTDAVVSLGLNSQRLMTGLKDGTWARRRYAAADVYGGHAVLLVGYDSRGFIAKNSWGTQWGDQGYFRVNWDYHALYCAGAVILKAVEVRNALPSTFQSGPVLRNGKFRVKVQPRGRDNARYWQLSTWMETPRDADFRLVEYTVEGLTADGRWQTVARRAVEAGDTAKRTGAALDLTAQEYASVMACRQARVRIRVGDFLALDPGMPEASRWKRTVPFRPFVPQLGSSLDLTPE